jgi:hypothetical protein
MNERLARRLRIQEAATRGIRPVPRNPKAVNFPAVPFACDVRPRWCGDCHITKCPYGIATVPLEDYEPGP